MTTTHLIVHIGDAHLHPGPRNADRRRAIDQIIDATLGLPNLAAYVWPGDLFHARSSVEDRNWLDERLQRMAMRAPVVICYGNHDQPGDLDGFARLRAPYPIEVFSSPHVHRLRTATGVFASLFILPYPSRAGLVAAGVASAAVGDVGREALEAIFRSASAQLEAARTAGDITLMIGHVNVAGSVTSTGQPQIGREIEIDGGLLASLGHCPKLLNHIHKGQEIHGADYAGSVCRLDWGEVEEKRYLLVSCGCAPLCAFCPQPATCFGAYERSDDVACYACDACCGHDNEDGWCKPVDEGGIADAPRRWCYTVASVAIDVPPRYYVEGELTRDGFAWHILAGPGGELQPAPSSWAGCEVRVRCYYRASERSVLDFEVARAGFREARRLEFEPVAVQDRDIRAPQIAAARTLAEKVTVYLETNGQTPRPELLDKLAHLEHHDPAAILADAQALVVRVMQTPTTSAVENPALEEAVF